MKHSNLLSKVSGAALAAVASLAFLTTAAHAQAIYYFDPSFDADAGLGSYSGTGSGGTGEFDSDFTPDFYSPTVGSFDTTFPSASDGVGIADFDGTGGTVTVNLLTDATTDTNPQPVATNFDASSDYTVEGPGTIEYQVNDNGGSQGNGGNANDNDTFITNSSSSNVNIDANATVTETANTGNTYITNSGTGNLTLGATPVTAGGTTTYTTMAFSGSTTGAQSINITGSGILFNESVTNTIVPGSLGTTQQYVYVPGTGYVLETFNLGQEFAVNFNGGTNEFNGDIRGASTGYSGGSGSFTDDDLQVSSGTLLVDNGNFDRFIVSPGASLLTNGAVTVTATNSIENGTIGGATADLSTFTGDNPNFGGNRILTAVAGGRVNFSGSLYGGGTGAANDLQVTGGGVIAFTDPNGENYAGGYTNANGDNSEIGTDIQHGTLLAENTNQYASATGSGFNQNSNATSSLGENNIVEIENVTAPTAAAPVAVLGGTGYILNQVVAAGSNSTITPGDVTPSNLVTTMPANSAIVNGSGGSTYVVTPGTLHLFNGLAAVNGLTANFVLTGTPSSSSMVDIATTSINPDNGQVSNGAPAVAFSLDGPVTINLYGTVNTADTYTLFTSATGTPWDISGATYDFTGVPAGYTAVESYVADDASGNEDLDVSFTPAVTAIPEPSTWALMGLGALVLIGSGKFRKLRV